MTSGLCQPPVILHYKVPQNCFTLRLNDSLPMHVKSKVDYETGGNY
jgi:hypothetical protein